MAELLVSEADLSTLWGFWRLFRGDYAICEEHGELVLHELATKARRVLVDGGYGSGVSEDNPYPP